MNNDFFFYQDGGKTVGPVTLTDLKGRIKDGKVRLFDLILKEGDAAWRMALEHTEFKEEFKDKSKSALRERPWVCLQRKSPDNFDFTTTGPFSQDEVREALMAGKVSYTDYVWRSGFPEWKRIGLLEDFNPRLKNVKAPPPEAKPPEDATDLVKNVVEMKRPRPPLPEMPPPGAVTRDLTKSEGATPPPPIPEQIKVEPMGDVTHISQVTHTSTSGVHSSVTKKPERKSRRRKNVPWLDWGIVAILVVVLGSVSLVLSRNIKRTRTLEVPPATVVETLPPMPVAQPLGYEASEAELNAPEPVDDEPSEDPDQPVAPPPAPPVKEAKVEKPEPPKKIPSKPPTELTLNVQNRSNSQARVELRTNGSPDIPVYVQVVGVPGHVTSGASFYKYLKVKSTGDAAKPLDLSKIKLPQGKLIFRASSGDLKKEAKLNVGTNDPQYKSAVNRVRKLHAYAIWQERQALLRLSKLLGERVAAAAGGQKFNGKGLEQISQVRMVNGYKYALFDDWFELKTAMDDAKKQASSSTVAKVKRVHDKMVAYTVWR